MFSSGDWSFGVFVWLFVGAARMFFWLWMCCDTIHKRKYFLWTMIITWLIQVALFVNIQGELFTGPDNYCEKQHVLKHMVEKWGLKCGGAITILELFSIINLGLFAYFTAVAYEHFHLGNKDKKLLEKEAHRKEVMKASLETQKRLKAQQKQMAMDAEVERRRSEMSQKEQANIAQINQQYGSSDQPLLNASNRSQGVAEVDAPPASVDAENPK